MSKCYKKICPKCFSQSTKKDWKRKWRQSYKCWSCNHVWMTQSRNPHNKIELSKQLYHEYSHEKQTYNELSIKHWLSTRSIQRYLDSYQWEYEIINPQEIILLVDTTYFGDWWLMVFKDAITTDILLMKIVDYETNEQYSNWILELINQWWRILAMVVDGRKWLLNKERWFPVQLCNFHQQQVVRRLISNNPKTQAGKDLKRINNVLHQTDRESFELWLSEWYEKHKQFVEERWIDTRWKKYYIHKKLRSAYYSLVRNSKYLFVYQNYYDIIVIPNTTNGLEWVFSHVKYKVNLHRWLRIDRKKKLVIHIMKTRKKPHLFVH